MTNPAALPALPPGSDAELTAAFLRGTERIRFVLGEAIRAELLGLVAASDAVAPVKIAWWRDELARCANGQPRHPLTQKLSQALERPTPEWDIFAEHLVLVETWLRHEQTSTAEECRLRLFRQYAPGLYVGFDAQSETRAQDSNHVHRVAIARGFADLADALRHTDNVSPLALPEPWLADDGVTTTAARDALRQRCVDAGLAELESLPAATIEHAPVDVLEALVRGKLRALRRGSSPGRLGRVFTAWNAARQSGRTTNHDYR